jgi:dTDP-4-dehydrorhamnose reductase
MVNGTSVGILAEVAAEAQIPFVTYSTDYVFDGQGREPYVESSPTDPINAYGASKLIGERLALQANPRTLVIRTSWVISGTHPNFVATMLRLAGEGRSVRVVNDQHGCPTVATDLARATLQAMKTSATGLLHLTNAGATTWFELARTAVALAGLDSDLIQPCPTEEYPTPARRPSYSVLGSERIEGLGMNALPPWQDSLPDVVREQMRRTPPT